MVEKGAPLFDIETDKAAMEVEAPASGRLAAITAKPGDKLAVGSVIALIPAEGEVAAPVMTATAVAETAPQATALPAKIEAAAPPFPVMAPPVASAPRATPAARDAARKAGLVLAEFTGTGPLGRIQRDDVSTRMHTPEMMPYGWAQQPGPLNIRRRKGAGPPLSCCTGSPPTAKAGAPWKRPSAPARP